MFHWLVLFFVFVFTLAVTVNKSVNTVQDFQVPAFSAAGFTEDRRVCGLQQLKSRYVSQRKRGTEQTDEDNELKKNRTVFSVFVPLFLCLLLPVISRINV